jgi:hypothetical protein
MGHEEGILRSVHRIGEILPYSYLNGRFLLNISAVTDLKVEPKGECRVISFIR